METTVINMEGTRLADGSIVWTVHVQQGEQSIAWPCTNHASARKLAYNLRMAILEYTTSDAALIKG